MKKTISILLLVIFAVGIQTVAAAKKANRETVVFSVPMDCQGCVNKIEKNIAFEKGVTGLDIDFENQEVSVTYNASKTNPELLRAAFEKIGKAVRVLTCTADGEEPVADKE